MVTYVKTTHIINIRSLWVATCHLNFGVALDSTNLYYILYTRKTLHSFTLVYKLYILYGYMVNLTLSLLLPCCPGRIHICCFVCSEMLWVSQC